MELTKKLLAKKLEIKNIEALIANSLSAIELEQLNKLLAKLKEEFEDLMEVQARLTCSVAYETYMEEKKQRYLKRKNRG